jgi:pyruvate formate lyase activating enzyme
VVPKLQIVKRHLKEVGSESPMHFTQLYPTYRMADRPRTSIQTLEETHNIVAKEGVRYVYAGNVPGHRLENTYCLDCVVNC